MYGPSQGAAGGARESIAAFGRLIGENRFDEARAVLARAVEGRGEDHGLIREIILQISPVLILTDLCHRLITEYVRLNPDLGTYDDLLLRVMARVLGTMGQWAAAAHVQRQIVARRPGFDLDERVTLARLSYQSGGRAEASRILAGALEFASKQAARIRAGLDRRTRLCSLFGPSDVGFPFRAIGEMCLCFDLFLKARALGWLDAEDAAFVFDPKMVCNPALLDYFKDKVPVLKPSQAAHNKTLRLLPECRNSLHCLMVPGLGGVPNYVGYSMLLEAWSDQERPPTLTLKPRHRDDGRRALAGLGLGEQDWFVGVHIREEGFYGEGPDGYNALRCVAVADFLPMMRAITARGGWVVRLGDPTMTPLPPLPGVIDYAVSPLKSDWMDVFLCASARFMVGTNSGLYNVALLFGTPVVATNHQPAERYPLCPGDILLLCKYFSRREGRMLTLRECFGQKMLGQYSHFFFEQEMISQIYNSPEEITDAALQMIDQLEGREPFDAEEQALAEQFAAATDVIGHRGRYRPGRRYLRSMAPLLS